MVATMGKILSVTLHISQTIHHIIFIYGTHVWKDNTSKVFYIVSKFGVNSGIEEQKMAQNDKKNLSAALHISGSIHHMIAVLVHMCKMMIPQAILFIFWIFGFSGVSGRGVYLSHCISQELYIILSRSLVHRCKLMISPGILFSLFFKKHNIVNIKVLTFFIDPFHQYF